MSYCVGSVKQLKLLPLSESSIGSVNNLDVCATSISDDILYLHISILHQHLPPYAIYAAWTSARTAGGRSALSLINPSATCISMPGHWGWATATRARFVVVFVFDLHFLTTTCLHNDKNRATRDNFALLFSPSPWYKNTQKGNLLINTLGLV